MWSVGSHNRDIALADAITNLSEVLEQQVSAYEVQSSGLVQALLSLFTNYKYTVNLFKVFIILIKVSCFKLLFVVRLFKLLLIFFIE